MREENTLTRRTQGHNKTMKLFSLSPLLFISHIVRNFPGFIKLGAVSMTSDSCRYKQRTTYNCTYGSSKLECVSWNYEKLQLVCKNEQCKICFV